MSLRLFRTLRIAAVVAVGACGGSSVTDAGSPGSVAAVSLYAASGSLAMGATMQLSATARDAAGVSLPDKPVTWSTSRAAVATVSSTGLVTGVAEGTAIISASSEGKSASVSITVTKRVAPLPNFVNLTSDAGDYIGGGASYTYHGSDAILSATATSTRISVRVTGDESWFGEFQVPSGSALEKGSYPNATRYPFQASGAGLSWNGEGRGCNTLTGSFVIDSLTLTGGVLTTVDLTFEQHCEGQAPALRGTIHWRGDDTTRVAGPVLPLPEGLWQPPANLIPATGNYAYLQSDFGDWVGAGETKLYQPPTFPLAVSSTGRHLTVSVGGWNGDFEGMTSLALLQPGFYGRLQRYPFHNPIRGGLSWYGNGRGCNTLTGWFVIDRITYTATTLTSVELRFEQHCEGGPPALHGAIRWSQ